MISTDSRKKLFDLLYRNSSPDFIEYLRAYEGLPRPPQESFEVSCELANGIRVDNMRLAILCLRMRDILRWLSACRHKTPLIRDFLFENTTDECFGIGLADYPSGAGVCRIKIYNTYGSSQPQDRKYLHIQRLFSLLNIPDVEFRKDWERFRKVAVSGIDRDREEWGVIKVYFGPFPSEQLPALFSEALFKNEALWYDILLKEGLLPETFQICARYSRDGRSLRTGMIIKTSRILPYLRIFDQQKEVPKFLVDYYRIFPGLKLEYISMQCVPDQKTQFYFFIE